MIKKENVLQSNNLWSYNKAT